MQKVLFRVDGNANIGLGHVVRCMSLAEMLVETFECAFAMYEPDASTITTLNKAGIDVMELTSSSIIDFVKDLHGNEIVVLDGYAFDEADQQLIKNKGCKLVFIDDLHQQHFIADVVINHSLVVNKSDYSKEPDTTLCTGADYLLLRKEFLSVAQLELKRLDFDKVFLCMGGADNQKLSARIASMLAQLNRVNTINILIGSAYQWGVKELEEISDKIVVFKNLDASEIIEVMKNSDWAIVSASGIAYECAATGLPMLTGYYLDHQKMFYDALSVQPGIIGMGNIEELTNEKLVKLISDLKEKRTTGHKKLVDGFQRDRFLNIFKNLCPK